MRNIDAQLLTVHFFLEAIDVILVLAHEGHQVLLHHPALHVTRIMLLLDIQLFVCEVWLGLRGHFGIVKLG